mmetsp:Transcript_21046/g.64128  ORF Transcript_21046/g.64128 Transcript_21046/m.64128 type:complete len:331 (-) Transcript_21046:241-1233(-)|eukprot:CAMPEP_0118874716 /NCGR_PEP_ID=MMETSP1163-20130328/16049_1 /TAXON_ID=124430 /ORGANISM="Phaeomonas parva, Strain CCMP2877" /LENGTH=330 /DNA_ID=CAMNT_0006810133 /DNA_START=230 /DNA_END=1222 /DNA_ORIENTATION=-
MPRIHLGVGLALGLGAGFVAAVLYSRRLQRELETALAAREEERRGRIAAEQAARRDVQARSDAAGFNIYKMRIIARVATCFPDRRGTPRQPSLCPSTRGRIDIDPKVPEAAFEGLEEFSHVILLYVFHENTNLHKDDRQGTVKAKIAPPQLGGRKTGLYSTRTPHRVNPLGLSVVRVDALNLGQRQIFVSGLDLVDGTPLIDLKPYLPFDAVPRPSLRFPAWVGHNQSESFKPRPVRIGVGVLSVVEGALARGVVRFYDDVATLRAALEEVLSLDIRGLHQGRGKVTGKARPYVLRLDALTFTFVTDEDAVVVTDAVVTADAELIEQPTA